ncbi:MAG: bacteriohemerythrin [Gallionellaceae bacterium]
MNDKLAVQAELTQQLYSTNNSSQITSIVLAAILAYAQSHEVNLAVAIAWFSLIVLVSVFRTILAFSYQRSKASNNVATTTWLVRFRIGVLASALAWGSASILLYPAHAPEHQMFVIFMLGGMTAGGLVSYSADLFSAVVYTTTVLTPLIIRLFIADSSLSMAMSVALMLYLSFMVMSSRVMSRRLYENITLNLDAVKREKTIKASEARYRLLLNHSPVGIIHYDVNLIITYCNDRFAELLKSSAEQLIGLDMKSLKERSILPTLREALAGEVGHYEGEYTATYSEVIGWISMTCAPSRDEVGEIVGGVGIVQEVTERKQAENALRESENRFRQMFERHSAVMLLLEPQSGIVVDANPAASDFYGYPLPVLCGMELRNINTESPEEVVRKRAKAMALEQNYFVFDHRLANGDIRTVEVYSSPVDYMNKPLLFSIIHDITERKAAEALIHKLAFYDALTQLPNRRLLNDRLDQMIASCKRSGHFGALMFLDLDNFKPLNDAYGHKVGDLLLIEVARRINHCIRATDTAARFGGDEFVVMLSDLQVDQSKLTEQLSCIAEKIRASLAEPYLLKASEDGEALNTLEHHCTSSIGAVVFNQNYSREDVIKFADMAMYQAKELGRDRVFIDRQGADYGSVPNKNNKLLRLTWDDSYNCGNASIDEEHRKLFDLANLLIESAFSRDINPAMFDDSLNELIKHVSMHFADEEAVLAQHRYSDLDAHVHAHKLLIENVHQLRDSAASGGVTMGELLNFLAEEMIAQHMLKVDRKFYSLFKNDK